MTVDTYSIIQPRQVFDYNFSPSSSIQTAAPRYSSVWGSLTGRAGYWKAGNPSMDIGYYLDSSSDNGTFDDNTLTNNLAWWQANHPSWVLYKADQTTPALVGSNGTRLDQTNSAVRSYQISTFATPASASGNYTLFDADNVDLLNYYGAVGTFQSGVWTPMYTGAQLDSAFKTTIVNWVTATYTAVKALSPALKFGVNLGGCGDSNPIAFTDSSVVSIIQNCDYIFDEQGVTQSGSGLLNGSSWVSHIQYSQAIQQTYGKGYVVTNKLPDNTPATIQYCMASYLMGKYHNSTIFCLAPNGSYGVENYLDEYSSKNTIGTPQEDMTLDGSGLYRRTFSGGIVLVNNTPGTTYTYSYRGRTYTLLPTSAMVLTNFHHGKF